jgi:hypothetical protein
MESEGSLSCHKHNAALVTVKADGTYSYHLDLKG